MARPRTWLLIPLMLPILLQFACVREPAPLGVLEIRAVDQASQPRLRQLCGNLGAHARFLSRIQGSPQMPPWICRVSPVPAAVPPAQGLDVRQLTVRDGIRPLAADARFLARNEYLPKAGWEERALAHRLRVSALREERGLPRGRVTVQDGGAFFVWEYDMQSLTDGMERDQGQAQESLKPLYAQVLPMLDEFRQAFYRVDPP